MIFYNYKWSITFKICESLYCTPVTYIILYISYTSILENSLVYHFPSQNHLLLINVHFITNNISPLLKLKACRIPIELPINHKSDQIRSVAHPCPTLCNPMNCSTPGLPVHHQLLEVTQTHIHRVSDAIQPSYLLSSPFPPALNPSQQQSLFQ